MIFFFLLLLWRNVACDGSFTTPGNFADGTFGNWSVKRVPYPPPSKRSLYIEKVGVTPMVLFQLRKDDPLKSGSARNELTVPPSFYEPAECTEEVYFSTALVKDGLWFGPSENGTAVVIAQFHAVNGESPPIGVRITNSKKLAITKNTEAGREYLYMGPLPPYDKIFNLRFLIHWDTTSKGYLQVWLDGKQIVDHKGPVGQDSPHYYFKYGIYNSANHEIIPESVVLKVRHGAYYHRYL